MSLLEQQLMVFVKGLAAHCSRYFVWHEGVRKVSGCAVRNAAYFIVWSLQYEIALKWLPEYYESPGVESR